MRSNKEQVSWVSWFRQSVDQLFPLHEREVYVRVQPVCLCTLP